MSKVSDFTYPELFKLLKEYGVPYEGIRFKALLVDLTLHALDSSSCHKANTAKDKRTVTWGEVADRGYLFCNTCSGHISHLGGWSQPMQSMSQLSMIAEIGQASRMFLEADANGVLSSAQVRRLVEAAHQMASVTGNMEADSLFVGPGSYSPSVFSKFSKTQLDDYRKLLRSQISGRAQVLLASILKMREARFPEGVSERAAEAIASDPTVAVVWLRDGLQVGANLEIAGETSDTYTFGNFFIHGWRLLDFERMLLRQHFKARRHAVLMHPMVIPVALRVPQVKTFEIGEHLEPPVLETLSVLLGEASEMTAEAFETALVSAKALELN